MFDLDSKDFLSGNYNEDIENLVAKARELQAENERLKKASEWVSVDDVLPESGVGVLVTNSSHNDGRNYELAIRQRKLWFALFQPIGDSSEDNILDDVTHWKPIEPPKEGI